MTTDDLTRAAAACRFRAAAIESGEDTTVHADYADHLRATAGRLDGAALVQLVTDPADWPRCTFCQERAAEVLRTVEADEGFGSLRLDACRACETNPDYWDEPGAEIIRSATEQRR